MDVCVHWPNCHLHDVHLWGEECIMHPQQPRQMSAFATTRGDKLALNLQSRKYIMYFIVITGYLTHSTHLFHGPLDFCPGLAGWAGTRKVKPIWILLKQEAVSGSGFSWAICKPAPCPRQITMPVPHHSFFYRPDALRAAQPTASKCRENLVKFGVVVFEICKQTDRQTYRYSCNTSNPYQQAK